MQENAHPRSAQRFGRLDVLILLDRQHNAAHQSRIGRPRNDNQRKHGIEQI